MGCIQSVPTNSTIKKDFDDISKGGIELSANDRKVSIIMREKRAANARQNVFAESIFTDAPIEITAIPKPLSSKKIITDALAKNFLFYTIPDAEINVIVDLMTEKKTETGDVVIREGDTGDFFYVVESGQYGIAVGNVNLSVAQKGSTFGELALIYNCPRTATITCAQPGRLWALDRLTFRRLVARTQADQIEECKRALKKVGILQQLTETQIGQLAAASQIVTFAKGERIIKKGERGNVLYIIKSGTVICSDAGDVRDVESIRLSDSDYFGERALLTNEPRAANVTAETNVTLIALDRQTFDDLLGSLKEVIDRNMSVRVLQSIPLLKSLSSREMRKLMEALELKTFKEGEFVIREGDSGDTFYIIKTGTAIVKRTLTQLPPTSSETNSAPGLPTGSDENKVVNDKHQVATLSHGNFFGEMSLLRNEPRQADVIAGSSMLECLTLNQSKFIELLGPLEDFFNREAKARKNAANIATHIDMDDLEVMRTLGAGTFGRVKLVCHRTTKTPYAMKILNKANVVAYKQQHNVVHEKNIMAQCDHPFILKLIQTYKDNNNLYLLVEFVQGGELFSYLHCQSNSPGRLQNDHARFYASHVLMAIEYLHERNIIYRDLKPENLLIDPQGYLKMVDFGFAKVVEDRTYTLCGTPEYLAPELVLGKGHNKGVDYWALGVLIYEMLVGHSPFAGSSNPDQMQICRSIVKDKVNYPKWLSPAAIDLISKLLDKDVTKRLGLTHGGTTAIRDHSWFNGLKWEAIYEKAIAAPYKPKCSSALDTSNFGAVLDTNEHTEVYKDDGTGWDENF